MTFYINIVLTEEQQASVEKFMAQSGYHWIDFVRIEIPHYYQFPYQIQYVFQRKALAFDEDYPQWRKGDTFVHHNDPAGRTFVATVVDREAELVTFIDPEEGEVLAKFTDIRRIKKRGQ